MIQPPTPLTSGGELAAPGAARGRVTQGDIARAAGVHNTTVSLALRNSPLIPAGTRQRLRQLAERMGYRADPALRALMHYRSAQRRPARTRPLFYLTHGPTAEGWRDHPALARHFAAAQRRAVELGYTLEHLWLGEPELCPARLAQLLRQRPAAGVLLGVRRAPATILADAAIDWTRLAALQLGLGHEGPALHRVAIDAAAVLRLALHQIRARGGRRIGLVLAPEEVGFVAPSWSDVFHAEFHRGDATDLVSTLVLPAEASSPAADAAHLADWTREHQPGVIVGFPGRIRAAAMRGGRIPRDAAYVELLTEGDSAIAGVGEHQDQLASLAIETLVQQIERNTFGLPAIPTTTLIGGVWQEGASLALAVRRR